jgi:uncharacterized membrane protein
MSLQLFHPATVHFPIALLLASTLFTLLYVRGRQRAFASSAYHCLVAGWLGGVVTTLAGLIAAVPQVVGPDAPHADKVGWVNAHAGLGIAALLVFGQALLRYRRDPALLDDPQRRRGYLALLLGGSALLVAGGWLGGHLVYSLGLGLQ